MKKILTRIGSTLETMLKVDKITSLHSRGKYARICVELDLDKPLASHLYLRGMKIFLEYEGLHSICFRCGKYGHKKDTCREILEVDSMSNTNNNENTQHQPMDSTAAESTVKQAVQHEEIPQMEKEQRDLEMGPWNIPKYVIKKKKSNVGKPSRKNNDGIHLQEPSPRVVKKTHVEGINEEVSANVKSSLQEVEVQEVPMVEASEAVPKLKSINNGRVRNPLGGKNPQLAVKGKKLAKPIKHTVRKEKSNRKSAIPVNEANITAEVLKPQAPGKENIPSSSNMASNGGNQHIDEADIMAYIHE